MATVLEVQGFVGMASLLGQSHLEAPGWGARGVSVSVATQRWLQRVWGRTWHSVGWGPRWLAGSEEVLRLLRGKDRAVVTTQGSLGSRRGGCAGRGQLGMVWAATQDGEGC